MTETIIRKDVEPTSERKQYFTQLAGEYLVAGELFRQQIFAYVTFGQAKSFDILAVGKNNKIAKVEVKTTRNNYSDFKQRAYPDDNHWMFNIQSMNKDIEKNGGLNSSKSPDDKFYVFVALCGDKPDYYVFDSQMVFKAFRDKIKERQANGGPLRGMWDLKLSRVKIANNISERFRKDDWSILRNYLSS